MAQLETMVVVDKAGNQLVINVSDFDATQHQKPGSKKASVRKSVRVKAGG